MDFLKKRKLLILLKLRKYIFRESLILSLMLQLHHHIQDNINSEAPAENNGQEGGHCHQDH